MLSAALCVPQRRHRTDGLLHRNQDRVPAAEGQGGGGYPGNRVPSPHRQVGAGSRGLLGRDVGMDITRGHGDGF